MAYFSPVNWLASTYAPWFLEHSVGFEEDGHAAGGGGACYRRRLRGLGRLPGLDPSADRVENRFHVDMLRG